MISKSLVAGVFSSQRFRCG